MRGSVVPCATLSSVPAFLAALDAFFQEHRRCGDLDGGFDGGSVWLACSRGHRWPTRLARLPKDRQQDNAPAPPRRT